ncbi:lipopolysaccharide biosynthesis protein [Granulosicoccus sp.]|nr:lipopolysaccharide biosynthesis protein [Granulosicoccus sp.]MDB4222423.1 lipopolysaccharide biosynthesis protein [Granulosicoccus sp.]
MRCQFAWNFGAQAVGLILPPLLIIALARILVPSDFGVFALLTIIIAAIQAVSLGPLGQVIVKSERDDIGDFIFSAQMLIGVAMAILLYVISEPLATLFNEQELTAPLRVSSLVLLINPFVDTAIRMSMRKIAFRAVFVRRVITPIANATISIPLALSGEGYWALVWGQIGGLTFAALVLLGIGGWRPRLNFNIRAFTDDLTFTGQMVLQGGVRWLRNQSDMAILGTHTTSETLGQYDMGRKLAGLPFAALVEPVAQVMYAVLSDHVRKGKGVRDLFLVAQRRVLMIALPSGILMVLNAEGLVTMILGEKWSIVIPVFTISSVTGMWFSIVGSNVELFKAKGKPKTMTQFMFVRAAFSVPVFLILAPYGIYPLAIGVLALACVFSPINVYLTMRLIECPIGDYFKKVLMRPLLVATFVAIFNLAVLAMPVGQVSGTIINILTTAGVMVAAIFYWEPALVKLRR